MSEERLHDILQPVPLEEWPILKEKINLKWPLNAYYYLWIQNAIRWKTKDPNFPIEFYSSSGDSSSSTFLAISHFSIYIVIGFTSEADYETLKRLIRESKYIDWSQGVYFSGVYKDFLPSMLSVIESVQNEKNVEYNPYAYSISFYHKSLEDSTKVQFDIPKECYLKMLDKSHIPAIHSVWPNRDPVCPDHSIKYLNTTVAMNGGIGLFLKEDHTLVSWALHTDWDGIGIVQTLEGHTRKGYAKVVTNALTKKLADEGIPATLFIVDGNTSSEKLFTSLGFNKVNYVYRIILRKPKQKIAK